MYFHISVFPYIQKVGKYILSIYTEYNSYTYITTNTQVILIKCYKSTAPYISSYQEMAFSLNFVIF